jgi:hypothetical protein
MKELLKPVLKDEEEEVVQALCEGNSGLSWNDVSSEETDEIIF